MSSSESSGAGEPLPRCPGCAAGLVVGATQGKRRYVCTSCGGLLCGVAVFREIAGAEHGQRLWAAAVEAGPAGNTGPCPFCSAEMRASPHEQGRVWICMTCEMAWVDKVALGALMPQGASAPVAAETTVTRCPNCGAPLEHSWDEQCAYCGAALEAPTKVVVVDRDSGMPPEHESGWHEAGEVIGGIIEGMRRPHAF
jgi:Zn-finger nucleic acid-binding protein